MSHRAPLDRGLNVAVLQIASRLFPSGFDVGPEAPATLADLQSHVSETGRMIVWDGASADTIYGDAEVNYAFRAWHDWCHLHGGHPFDDQGEADVCAMQRQHLLAVYGAGHSDMPRWLTILDAEVNGQVAERRMTGAFPPDQRAFVAASIARQGFAI